VQHQERGTRTVLHLREISRTATADSSISWVYIEEFSREGAREGEYSCSMSCFLKRVILKPLVDFSVHVRLSGLRCNIPGSNESRKSFFESNSLTLGQFTISDDRSNMASTNAENASTRRSLVDAEQGTRGLSDSVLSFQEEWGVLNKILIQLKAPILGKLHSIQCCNLRRILENISVRDLGVCKFQANLCWFERRSFGESRERSRRPLLHFLHYRRPTSGSPGAQFFRRPLVRGD